MDQGARSQHCGGQRRREGNRGGKNDLTAAPELEIQEGDLVLRDRGYLIADEIQRHLDRRAACIYRHKTGVIYLDKTTLPGH